MQTPIDTTTTTTIPEPPTPLPTADNLNVTWYEDESRSGSARPWLLSLPTILLVLLLPGWVCWHGARLARGAPPLPSPLPLPSPYNSSRTLRPDTMSPNVVVNDNFIGGQWVLGSGLDYGNPPPTPQHIISQTSTTSTITTATSGTPLYDEPRTAIYAQAPPIPGYEVPRVLQTIREEEPMFNVELDEP